MSVCVCNKKHWNERQAFVIHKHYDFSEVYGVQKSG